MQRTPTSRTRDHSSARQWWLLLTALLLMLAASLAAPAMIAPIVDAQTDETEAAAEDVAERVNPSVVTVYTYTPRFSPGASGNQPTGAGSGWAYMDDGLVITNAHVVLDVDMVRVMTFAGDLIPATVVGTDWYQDVAVLRLEPDDGQDLPPAATVGDSSRLRVGDPVITIGTPHGQFANTVSVGKATGVGISLDTGSGYTLENLIRHNASLSPGNSGGPLVSTDAEVVGMNVASRRIQDSGEPSVGDISFAIEGNMVVAIADEIIANGSANRPFLGAKSQVSEQGQVVVEVEPDSPAADAGLQPGDVITAIDSAALDADSAFVDLLYRYQPGDTITLTIDRDGETVMLDVVLGLRPADT